MSNYLILYCQKANVKYYLFMTFTVAYFFKKIHLFKLFLMFTKLYAHIFPMVKNQNHNYFHDFRSSWDNESI